VPHPTRYIHLVSTFAVVALLSGCFASGSKSSSDSGQTSKSDTSASAPAKSKIGPGMNERGEVVDPKLVTAGSGQTVKGLNDWEGEITGKPVAGSKFARLQIGMTLAQARDLAGQPTDQGAHVTGKAFIPFFYGSDRYRYEMVYKGHGRLIFAGSAGYDSNAHLIWIIHSANETGYR
jgi:hypothetical protein